MAETDYAYNPSRWECRKQAEYQAESMLVVGGGGVSGGSGWPVPQVLLKPTSTIKPFMLTNSTQITVDGVYISFLALTEFFGIVIRSYVRINIRCMRNRIQPNILMRIQIQGRSERGPSKDPDPSYSITRLPYYVSIFLLSLRINIHNTYIVYI
jgi:hypothetical protein